jgi:cytidyltransferase-like protein
VVTINYTDLCGDLFHCEHVAALKLVKELGGTLYVGVHNDETIIRYKRHPVMTMEERIIVIEACKYVDRVIPNAPLQITEEFLNKYNIDMVHIQERPESEIELMYRVPRSKNMLMIQPLRPRVVSTGRIIQRVIDLHSQGLLDRRPLHE